MKVPASFKNIYFRALWISMGTFAVGFPLGLFGTVGGIIPIIILGMILIWPVQIFTLVVAFISDQYQINVTYQQTPYLLYALIQYFGYLGLLFGVRKFRGRKTSAKKWIS